jgi:thiol-disulfide isomerase/thioredoxin
MKGLLNDANLEARADRIYQDYFRKQVPYWDLPECRGKEVLKSILANYPGKYVYIDFWSTGCGPCISGIKRCYNNRRELMTGKHDKFVMIFITSDPEEAYEPFRKEWLEGAESYRLSQDDYNVLAGMFNFSAIPHHEMITPDGRAVTNVPEMFVVNPDDPDPELQSKQ